MRSRRSSARWLLLALVIGPGCFFRPILHPPSATDSDGAASSDARDNRHQDGSVADVNGGADVTLTPNDDCSGFYDQSTGTYSPDAHHADGAICMPPETPDGGVSDVSSVTDATDATDTVLDVDDAAEDSADASADDASDEASVKDATDEATDAGTADDATPADSDAGE